MTTEYTHALAIAVPSTLIDQANHLACLMGESAADIETFKQATYTDGTINYLVAHTVCTKAVVEAYGVMTLPDDPAHVPDTYDRAKAEAALTSIQSGDILVAVDVDPHQQFSDWGLSKIPVEEEI